MKDPSRRYRRLFRAWRSSLKLRRELRFYNTAFESDELVLPDEEGIREAVKAKFSNLKPKPKGKLNILAIYHHYNWENESLKPALRKFGFVRHYDWLNGLKQPQSSSEKHVKSDTNNGSIRRVRQWVEGDSTDVIFSYVSGGMVTQDSARGLAALGIPMINISLNDKEAFVGKIRNRQATGVRDICRHFDVCWTSTEDAVKKYCVEGTLPIYLPEGANPEVHKPYDVNQGLDVSFVGQCYGYRPRVVKKLKEEGIHVEAYGNGWPNGSLSTEEMVRMYSRSKINLGFGGVAGYKNACCLKGRDFEIPMSGGLYVTEYCSELESCYNLEEEIVTFSSVEDLVAKIRYLLSNPEAAQRIRMGGFHRARAEHTWEMRFEKVFGAMGLIEPGP